MLTMDEIKFPETPNSTPNSSEGSFECPKLPNMPCNPHFPKPPKPVFTIQEEFMQTVRRVNETLARVLRFEERIKCQVDEMTSHLTADNVAFKDLCINTYNQFAEAVHNEVNTFEAEITNAFQAFEGDYDNLKTALEDRITQYYTNIEKAFNDYVTAMNDNINSIEDDLRQEWGDYKQNNLRNWMVFKDEAENRLDGQDAMINDAVAYMKTNLTSTLYSLLMDKIKDGTITVSEYWVSVKDFGAVGDGITDDTKAIQAAVDSGANTILIPDGTYKTTEPIIIRRENLEITSTGGGLKYGACTIHGSNDIFYIIGNARFLTIRGITIKGTYPESAWDNQYGIVFRPEDRNEVKNITKVTLENITFVNLGKAISNTYYDYNPVTLWNCEFKNLHFYSGALISKTAFEISNTDVTHGANFALTFKNIFVGHSTVIIKNSKGTFENCNFGFSGNYAEFKSSYFTFVGCNFECDEVTATQGYIKLGNMAYEFNNCCFVMRGDTDEPTMFAISSDAQVIEFKNIYASKMGGRFFPVGSFGGLIRACGVKFRGYISEGFLPEEADIYGSYRSTYTRNDNALPDIYDSAVSNLKHIDKSLYYSPDRKQIENYRNGDIFDVFGNAVNKTGAPSNIINLGGGLRLEWTVKTYKAGNTLSPMSWSSNGNINVLAQNAYIDGNISHPEKSSYTFDFLSSYINIYRGDGSSNITPFDITVKAFRIYYEVKES